MRQTIELRVYSSRHGRHMDEWSLMLGESQHEMDLIKVYPECRLQRIIGFGGAFTEASAHVFARMPEGAQERLLRAYFGSDGARYTLCRAPIMSCDFSLSPYSYHLRPLDAGLRGLDLSHDDREIIPLIRRAQALEPTLELIASPWSPPAYMKTNFNRRLGGRLRRSFYGRWAKIMARYVAHLAEAGIPVTRLTIQNEPEARQIWESCIMSGVQEASFAAERLRPELARAGFGDVKLLGWDHNKQRALERARSAFDDPAHPDALDGLALHWYSGDHFEAVGHVRQCWPHKELIASEACEAFAGTGARLSREDELAAAEHYAHDIMGDLNSGVSAWIDWNLLLDERGGPNHVGNFCAAPAFFDTTGRRFGDSCKDGLQLTDTLAWITHFSRFIRPGAHRVLVTRCADDIEATAAMNTDGSLAVVLLNRQGQAAKHTLCVHMGEHDLCGDLSLPGHTIMTVSCKGGLLGYAA